MCQETYVAFNNLITKSYTNIIKTDDDINSSNISEYIKIRDDTMTSDTMNQCDANDIVLYLTTMWLNCRPQHDCIFGGFLYTPHLIVVLLCTK